MSSVVLAVTLLAVLIAVFLAFKTTLRWSNGQLLDFPFWYVFIASTCALAYIVGVWYAKINYTDNFLAFSALLNLAHAHNVDPSTMPTARYMDVGSVTFVPGTKIDFKKYVGFKNSDVYCVAPIVHEKSGDKNLRSATLGSYDYWAVGLNCCSGDGFKCGQYNDPKAHSGMRLMREDQRGFYQLAVQEAAATYGIRANNPLFFYWVEDPREAIGDIKATAITYWRIGMVAFAAGHLLLTVAAAMAYHVFFLKV
eukprot:TRINITY_DN2850_c0_g1_i3.p1 TRINITY_DN2850_c0_g1~~TRINITY_DN2850_c0_g1_i3.p1  ORF type:complete len:253 (+),score=31.04 TRINITY_DN2850_c0_g1_i3:159-917(+)